MPTEQVILPIFRHPQHSTTSGNLWQQARAAAYAADPFELLLALAHLECALEDAGWAGARPCLQTSAMAAAAAYLGMGPRPEIEAIKPKLPPNDTPLTLGEWEGIQHYALWPAGFADAARRWRIAHPGIAAWVIGLRSAGSLLAPIVAAAIGAERWITVRPEGHPYDRQISFEAALDQELSRWPEAVLVVDEGPGRSGSSLGGALRRLEALGIAMRRIAVLPAYAPPPEQVSRFENSYAAAHWHDWQVYAAATLPAPGGAEQDLSGGRWRGVLHPDQTSPVWATHERLKYLADNGRTLIKFAGLGAHGRSVRERARRLATAGWGPPLHAGDEDGPWVRYERLVFAPLVEPTVAWCQHAGRYLAWVEQEFGLELDGRMWPCEWGETKAGWIKFDGTDHHDDPFLPGPRDIAWDLATVGEELGRDAGEAVVAAYCRASGMTLKRLAPRLALEAAAYRQFREAWRAMAAA